MLFTLTTARPPHGFQGSLPGSSCKCRARRRDKGNKYESSNGH